MRISDPYKETLELGSDLTRDTIGIVFKTQKELKNRPMLGVIVPKLMLGYQFKSGDKPQDKSISISGKKCINAEGKFWDSSINVKNYILMRPYLNQNQAMPVYVRGDKVVVTMIDNDIKTLAFYPYSINRLGQRKNDVLWFGVPANKKENTELGEDNTYYIKFDSYEKNITFSTSKKNGEICEHTIAMNGKVGKIVITDNSKKRDWIMDFQKDSVTTTTSGTKIEQVGNVINGKADTINWKAESEFNIETDTMNIKASTIKSEADDVTYKYDNFEQETSTGKWKIDKAEWEGNSYKTKYSTYFNDTPTIGLNGQVILPNYVIGTISDINAPVPPTNGQSAPKGSMLLQTDPSGVPLVKFPQLLTVLTTIAAAADAFPSGGGSATAIVSSMASQMNTTKIMAS